MTVGYEESTPNMLWKGRNPETIIASEKKKLRSGGTTQATRITLRHNRLRCWGTISSITTEYSYSKADVNTANSQKQAATKIVESRSTCHRDVVGVDRKTLNPSLMAPAISETDTGK